MTSDEFALKGLDTRKLFRPHSRAMLCRQMIWKNANETDAPIAVADLVRDNPEFRSAEIYRAAKHLVRYGILTREDVSWAAIEKGSERTRYRCAVKLVPPYTDASRIWK